MYRTNIFACKPSPARFTCVDDYQWAIVRQLSRRCVASVTQAPRCGAMVCRTHLRLDAESGFHCDRNYVCAQILGAYIIS